MLALFEGTSTVFDETKAVLKITQIIAALDDEGKDHVLTWLRFHYFDDCLVERGDGD